MYGKDPIVLDPDAFEDRVRQRVRGKRTYVLEEMGTLIFKVDVGPRSQYGAELEGLYTVPSERGKGHATLSLGQICRHLLSSIPRLVLRVPEESPVARMARKVGFVPGRAHRLVMIE
jgi:predicted GNAT family acetyltransferase